jgi:hypothetical protein
MNDPAADARPHDHAEHEFSAFAGTVKRFGHREAVGVILDFHPAAQEAFKIRFDWLAIEANGIRILEQASARRYCPGRPDSESVRLFGKLTGKFIVECLDAIEDMTISVLGLGLDALPEKLLPLGIEDNPFELRSTQIHADSKKLVHLMLRAPQEYGIDGLLANFNATP